MFFPWKKKGKQFCYQIFVAKSSSSWIWDQRFVRRTSLQNPERAAPLWCLFGRHQGGWNARFFHELCQDLNLPRTLYLFFCDIQDPTVKLCQGFDDHFFVESLEDLRMIGEGIQIASNIPLSSLWLAICFWCWKKGFPGRILLPGRGKKKNRHQSSIGRIFFNFQIGGKYFRILASWACFYSFKYKSVASY